MDLTILGYNSAIPTMFSHTSGQYLQIGEIGILIDCGEGTQVQLRKAKIKFNSIQQIFISHLHGDHVLGLAALLCSFSLLGRTSTIEIFGPEGIKNFIEFQLTAIHVQREFSISFKEIKKQNQISELIFENSRYSVRTIPLLHRIQTNGYFFKERIDLHNLNYETYKKYIKKKNLNFSSQFIEKNKNNKSTNISKFKSYAYCSDTSYNEKIISIIENANLLYHESTFLLELKELALQTGHSTASEAATIAKKSNVKKLILGHFSNRYSNYYLFLKEAQLIFSNTYLPIILKKINI